MTAPAIAGIGPEIVIQAYTQGLGAPVVIYGDTGALRRAAALVGADITILERQDVSQARFPSSSLEVIACSPALPDDLPSGKISAAAGRAQTRS